MFELIFFPDKLGFKGFPKGFKNTKIAILEYLELKTFFQSDHGGQHLNRQSLISETSGSTFSPYFDPCSPSKRWKMLFISSKKLFVLKLFKLLYLFPSFLHFSNSKGQMNNL